MQEIKHNTQNIYYSLCSICAIMTLGVPRWCSSKESTCQYRRHRFNPWSGKILWRRKWQRTPEFLPGEHHGQRSLAGYSPCDCSQPQLSTHTVITLGFLTVSLQKWKKKRKSFMFYKMCHVRWANLRSREMQKRDTQSSFIAYQKLSPARVGFL